MPAAETFWMRAVPLAKRGSKAHQMSDAQVQHLLAHLPALDLGGRLALLRETIAGRIVFTTSFGIEDQLLTHWIAETGLDISLATLDTGRLFSETLDVWEATEARYGLKIGAFAPGAQAAEQLLHTQGALGFRASMDARKACCTVRKVEPLARALGAARGWITGMRADQSGRRAALAFAELDEARELVKVSPLADWSRDEIAAEVARLKVPVNALHGQGFISIGCAPCTRAVHPGESERAGRWWWETDATKECGLHVDASGKLVRSPKPDVTAKIAPDIMQDITQDLRI
jgi:phosphoadenosine phosphosulfate reductase